MTWKETSIRSSAWSMSWGAGTRRWPTRPRRTRSWEALAQADAGNQETQALVDAVLTAVVLEHGERAMDPDAPETALGWRLAVPFFSVKEMREKYEIHARRGEDGKYILGVMERRSDL